MLAQAGQVRVWLSGSRLFGQLLIVEFRVDLIESLEIRSPPLLFAHSVASHPASRYVGIFQSVNPMPFLPTLPSGFTRAISPYNTLEAADKVFVTESALLAHLGQRKTSPSSTTCPIPAETEARLVEALMLIFRHADMAKASPQDVHDDLTTLTSLSDESAVLIAKFWKNRSKYSAGTPAEDGAEVQVKQALQHGTLVGLDWVLGVALSSSQCSRLQQPFVVVNVKVLSGQGLVDTHPIEMTFTEFQKFKRNMEDVAAALERS